MATSPALIEAVVAMTGETKASVSVTLSRLRKARLIPVGGRGLYAIPMNSEAAMRLLIAVCASIPLERDSAPTAVARFEKLPGRPPLVYPEESKKDAKAVVMPIDELSRSHTFGDALKRLIDAGGNGELFTYLDGLRGPRKIGYRNAEMRGFLRIQFMLPIPQARIEHQFGAWLRKTWVYGLQPLDFERYNNACRSIGLGDRGRLISLSEATVEEVGKAIARVA
jgi:hypothetical protein